MKLLLYHLRLLILISSYYFPENNGLINVYSIYQHNYCKQYLSIDNINIVKYTEIQSSNNFSNQQNASSQNLLYQLEQQVNFQNKIKLMNMLSLGDDISKFDKLAQTLKDDIMPIDKRFMGGGLTIQDLVQQNSFIITEMQKMKDVFLNYCQLNQKVYKQIMQHERAAVEHLKKISTAQSKIDKKIKNVSDDLSIVKDKIYKQISQAREHTQQNFENIQKQVKGKVNENSFVQRVKIMIEEYDSEPSQSLQNPIDNNTDNYTDNNTDNQGVKRNVISAGNSKKSKRGLTAEDIVNLKNQITPLINEVATRVTTHDLKFTETDSDFEKIKSKFTKTNQQTKWINQTIKEMKKNIQNQHQINKKNNSDILKQLRTTINQSVWQDKLDKFNTQYVKFPIKNIYGDMSSMKMQLDSKVEGLKPKFTEINKNIINCQAAIQRNKGQIKNINKNMKQFENREKITHQKIQEASHHIKQQNLKTIDKLLSTILQQLSKRDEIVKSVQNSIDQIVENTQEQVLKKVEKRFGKQLKEVRTDIVTLNKRASEISTNVKNNIQQVTHVKDVVSKKANFTDLVECFDKKVDKNQYKELQEMVNSPSIKMTQVYNTPTPNNENHHKMNKRRRSSYSKGHGLANYTRIDTDSVRLINLGWEVPSNQQTRQSLFKNFKSLSKNRHKSQRPSTANTLFLF